MDVFLFFIGILLFFGSIIYLAVSLIKKSFTKKRFFTMFAASFVLMIIGLSMPSSTKTAVEPQEKQESTNDNQQAKETKETEKPKAQEAKAKPVELTEEEKATKEADEAAKKVEQEKKTKADAEAKAKAEKAAAETNKTNLYVGKVKPNIDDLISVYDRIWSEFWTPTFQKLGSNEINQLDAYKNMKEVSNRYRALSTQFRNLENPKGLSKEDQEKVKNFKDRMIEASTLRQMAADDAAKMIDSLDFSPSKITDLESTVKASDSSMFQAVLSITELNMKYGVE